MELALYDKMQSICLATALDSVRFIHHTIRAFIKLSLLFLLIGAGGSAWASVSLGTGAGALLGGDLTDPENNGVDGSDTNWNWTSILASSENYWASEGAYNVFDNKVYQQG